MEIIYAPRALEDINYWKKTGNKAIQNKIKSLIDAIIDSPFEGIGKPEPLKYQLSGAWSRRIDREHRIVYEIDEVEDIKVLTIYSLRGHY